MTKFRVNVCLEPCAIQEVNGTLGVAMAPFDMNLGGGHWNSNGEWDCGALTPASSVSRLNLPMTVTRACSTRTVNASRCTAATWAVATFALLPLEGQWIDRFSLGPFAQPHSGEDASAAYARQANAYLDNLDDDCIIVRLLCHC